MCFVSTKKICHCWYGASLLCLFFPGVGATPLLDLLQKGRSQNKSNCPITQLIFFAPSSPTFLSILHNLSLFSSPSLWLSPLLTLSLFPTLTMINCLLQWVIHLSVAHTWIHTLTHRLFLLVPFHPSFLAISFHFKVSETHWGAAEGNRLPDDSRLHTCEHAGGVWTEGCAQPLTHTWTLKTTHKLSVCVGHSLRTRAKNTNRLQNKQKLYEQTYVQMFPS